MQRTIKILFVLPVVNASSVLADTNEAAEKFMNFCETVGAPSAACSCMLEVAQSRLDDEQVARIADLAEMNIQESRDFLIASGTESDMNLERKLEDLDDAFEDECK